MYSVAALLDVSRRPLSLFTYLSMSLIIGLCSLSTTSYANAEGAQPVQGIDFSNGAIPNLTVINNSAEYTQLGNNNISLWSVNINIGPDGVLSPKIIEWWAWPIVKLPNNPGLGFSGTVTNLKESTKHQYYDPRVKAVNKRISSAFPKNEIQSYAVSVCNIHADHLRSSGKTNEEIFSIDRIIPVTWSFYGLVTASYPLRLAAGDQVTPTGLDGGYEFGYHLNKQITCKKWTGGGADYNGGYSSDQPNFEILDIDATPTAPLNREVECPTILPLSVEVRTNVAGEFQSWVEHKSSSNSVSKGQTRNIGTGNANQSGFVQTDYILNDLHIPFKNPVNPSSNNGETPSGFASEEREDDEMPVNTGSSPDNHHTGWIRVGAKAIGHSPLYTPWQKYGITCKPQLNPDIPTANPELTDEIVVSAADLQIHPKPKQCGVQVMGQIYANYANAKLRFVLVNSAGNSTHHQDVKTQASAHAGNIAQFSEFIQFSSNNSGTWVGEDGLWTLPDSNNGPSNRKQGSFKIRVIGHSIESDTVEYDFICSKKNDDIQLGSGGIISPSNPNTNSNQPSFGSKTKKPKTLVFNAEPHQIKKPKPSVLVFKPTPTIPKKVVASSTTPVKTSKNKNSGLVMTSTVTKKKKIGKSKKVVDIRIKSIKRTSPLFISVVVSNMGNKNAKSCHADLISTKGKKLVERHNINKIPGGQNIKLKFKSRKLKNKYRSIVVGCANESKDKTHNNKKPL